MLDIISGDKGILILRVDIFDLSIIVFIIGGVFESLLVYNINNLIGRGFYYWDGFVWILIVIIDWKFLGNIGINLVMDFIGIRDNVLFRFRINNIERFEIINNGLIRVFFLGIVV